MKGQLSPSIHSDVSAVTKTNQIISEVGLDMSKFPAANHFASYPGFVPHNKITGGCIISSRTDRINSPAAQAFKKVVPSISQRDTALGAFYRRIVCRVGQERPLWPLAESWPLPFTMRLPKGGNLWTKKRNAISKGKRNGRKHKLLHPIGIQEMEFVCFLLNEREK